MDKSYFQDIMQQINQQIQYLFIPILSITLLQLFYRIILLLLFILIQSIFILIYLVFSFNLYLL